MDLSVITTRLRAGIRRLRPGVVAVAATALLTADAVGQTWTTEAFMPTPRIRHVAAGSYLNNGAGRVFVFAGDTGSTPYATIEAYDPVTNTWDPPSTYPNIPTLRSSPCVATDAAGRIWVIGGFSGGSVTHAVVEVFDPGAATPNWITSVPSLQTARCEAAAVFGRDGKLYVFGGRDASGATLHNSVERYDPGTGQWTYMNSMPGPSYHMGAAVGCGDTIVLVGLRNSAQICPSGSSGTMLFNTVSNSWSAGAPMPGACLGGRGAVRAADDRIYVINDGDYNVHDTSVYSYDPSNNTWRQEPNTSYGYTDLAAASLGDQIYAIGGVYRFPADPRRLESLTTGTTSLCNPPPPPPCVNLQSVFTSERFGALPTDRMQLVAYYDGTGLADLDIHLTNPSTGACCVLSISGIDDNPLTVREYVMNGFVPTGKFVVRNVVPNGAVDGVAFGLYWRDVTGARWKLQSRSTATGSGTPNFVGMWPYSWADTFWDGLMPPIVDDGFKRRQAQVNLSGAQVLGNGTWGIPTGRVPGDSNGDGCVDLVDLTFLLSTFGACCP
ncbi:MAG: hypothetical protein IT450_01770 [Phycisphaerales bacterium]|nr:hypothetical protein [Phycisphaerales bacterium]